MTYNNTVYAYSLLYTFISNWEIKGLYIENISALKLMDWLKMYLLGAMNGFVIPWILQSYLCNNTVLDLYLLKRANFYICKIWSLCYFPIGPHYHPSTQKNICALNLEGFKVEGLKLMLGGQFNKHINGKDLLFKNLQLVVKIFICVWINSFLVISKANDYCAIFI